MEYSEDIVINLKCENKKGQVKLNLFKRHKWVATIVGFCGILIVLDIVFIYNFINILQTLKY